MAVLPEGLGRLNKEDTKGSLSTIENYINYMQERIEHAMSLNKKTISDAGVSSVELYTLCQELQNKVASIESRLTALGQTTSLDEETQNGG